MVESKADVSSEKNRRWWAMRDRAILKLQALRGMPNLCPVKRIAGDGRCATELYWSSRRWGACPTWRERDAISWPSVCPHHVTKHHLVKWSAAKRLLKRDHPTISHITIAVPCSILKRLKQKCRPCFFFKLIPAKDPKQRGGLGE